MVRPELRQTTTIRPEQILTINPVMQQSLEILQMSSTDLEELIAQELIENPLLETQQDEASTGSTEEDSGFEAEHGEHSADLDVPDVDRPSEAGDDDDAEPRRNDEDEEHLEFLAEFDEYPHEYNRGAATEEPWRPEFVGRTTLSEHLLSQIMDLRPEPGLEAAARYVVYSMDRHGLISMGPDVLASDWEGPPELLRQAIDLVQSLEPVGVGRFSVREALLAQMDQAGTSRDSLEYRLVDEFFDLLPEKQYPTLARALRTTPREIQDAVERIRELNPYPGSDFSPDNNQVIIPDLIIEKVEGEYIALLNDSRFPVLVISERNRRILESPHSDRAVKKYVRENYARASFFLQSIRQRQRTVLQIGQFIADYQRSYFDDGIEALRPLTLKQVADELDRNQSTISRAINGKYLDSPQGVQELAFFFSRSLTEAGDVSTRVAQEELRRIIEEEDPSRPYSDADLSALLRAKGLVVKRRTVANYRKLLDIPSASNRRRY
ncbi:MAG: hypothetical protein AO396_01985 [Candidatus Fermentibacter daniensis]|nr:MAG: hypothetical protein AO396_01985 [Candidatus Fermentibacter daniensis]